MLWDGSRYLHWASIINVVFELRVALWPSDGKIAGLKDGAFGRLNFAFRSLFMSSQNGRVPMTQRGNQFLQEELRRIKSVERPKNIREIEEARAQGDLSENAEYHAAKERQSLLDFQIRDLEDKLARAEVIEVSKLSGEKVVFGATVKLEDIDTGQQVVYQIVGDHEAEPKDGKISISSPIARSLIGKSVGDEVEARIPAGVRKFEILDLEFVD